MLVVAWRPPTNCWPSVRQFFDAIEYMLIVRHVVAQE